MQCLCDESDFVRDYWVNAYVASERCAVACFRAAPHYLADVVASKLHSPTAARYVQRPTVYLLFITWRTLLRRSCSHTHLRDL